MEILGLVFAGSVAELRAAGVEVDELAANDRHR